MWNKNVVFVVLQMMKYFSFVGVNGVYVDLLSACGMKLLVSKNGDVRKIKKKE